MSLFDDSDLTELSSDEDDVPLSAISSQSKPKTSTGRPRGRPTEYVIQNTLTPPRTTQYSAQWIYENIHQNTIDLDPEYQRDVVWTEIKQVGLIDSILRNYYIPPIIFAVSRSREGFETRTCIDGKQRLTSIQRFMDGLIPHKDVTANKKLWYKEASNHKAGPKRTLLSKQYKQLFANKQIVCVEYEDLRDDQEREIFQRVQLGVALTPAERMQAISSPCANLIRDIQRDVLGSSGFDGYVEWDHSRGRDFHCLAQIAHIVFKSTHGWPTIIQLEKWLTDHTPVASYREGLLETFRIFVTLARDKAYNSVFQKPKVSPVEFVMIAVLIHKYRKQLSLTQLTSAIQKLRDDVRSKYDDIRSNTKVTKSLFTFIANKVKPEALNSDGKGDKAANLCVPRKLASASEGPAVHQKPTPKPSKRKRIVDSDDDDDDYEEKRKPAKSPKTKVKASDSTVKPQPKAGISSKAASGGTKTLSKSTSSASASKTVPPQTARPTVKPSPSFQCNSAGGSSNSTSKAPAKSTTSSRTATPVSKGPLTSKEPPQPATSTPSAALTPRMPTPESKPSTSAPSISPPVPSSSQQEPAVLPVPRATPKPPRPSIRAPSHASSAPSQTPTPIPTSNAPVQSVPPPIETNIKHEPMTISLTPAASSPSLSTLPDRLAPLRAAKAAIASTANTPSQSPVNRSFATMTLAPVSSQSNVVHDPRKRPAPSTQTSSDQPQPSTQSPSVPAATPTFPTGAVINQAHLEGLLRAAGLRPPAPQAAGVNANVNASENASIRPNSIVSHGNSSMASQQNPAVDGSFHGSLNGMPLTTATEQSSINPSGAPQSNALGLFRDSSVLSTTPQSLQSPSFAPTPGSVCSNPSALVGGAPNSALPSPVVPFSPDPAVHQNAPPPPDSASSTGSWTGHDRNDPRGYPERRRSETFDPRDGRSRSGYYDNHSRREPDVREWDRGRDSRDYRDRSRGRDMDMDRNRDRSRDWDRRRGWERRPSRGRSPYGRDGMRAG